MINIQMVAPAVAVDQIKLPQEDPSEPLLPGKMLRLQDPHSGITVAAAFTDDQWDQLDTFARGSGKITIADSLPSSMPPVPGPHG